MTIVPRNSPSSLFIPYLVLTSFTCGALVMVIEVLGSRVIGPFFGASLFVWTSLITVTLVALSAGYWSGGHLSDRTRTPDGLYAVIGLAGVAVLLIPLLKGMAIKLGLPLGLRLGALTSATLLFGPSLFLLGCVSPFIIKIAAREVESIGRTVGAFYALSTIGSFVGTVSAGFVLIAYFRVNQIFIATGLALLALSAGYFLLFRRSWLALPPLLLSLLIPFLIPAESISKTKTFDNGTRVTRIFARDGFYGNIQVHDYDFGGLRSRELVIDATTQGGFDPVTGMSVCEYPYYLEYIPTSINPGGKRCLVIGLGPGVVPRWYESKGVRTDVVDIDPLVFEVARTYFNFAVSGSTFVEDARYFLSRSSEKYDYIILDVFNGDSTPYHVLSVEALRTLKQRLAPGGVVGINMAGSIYRHTFMTASIIRTLREVFPSVDIYPAFDLKQSDGIGNLEVFAYDRPPVRLDPALLRSYPAHPLAAELKTRIGQRFDFAPGTPSMILTDSYNPIDFYDIRTKEYIRKRILGGSDIDFLLS